MTESLTSERPQYVEQAVLTWVASLGEAYAICSALAAREIRVLIEDELSLNQAMGGLEMPVGGIRLLVDKDDLASARAALAEIRPVAEAPRDDDETPLEQRLSRFFGWALFGCWFGLPAPAVFVMGLALAPEVLRSDLGTLRKLLWAGLMAWSLLVTVGLVIVIRMSGLVG